MEVLIMDIPGIRGESQAVGFVGKIDLLAYSHGIVMLVNDSQPGSERTFEGPKFSDFSVTKRLDSASPLLNLACCTHKDQGTVRIILGRRDQAGNVAPIMIYELSHVIISMISVSSGGDGLPVEAVTLNCRQVKWTFAPHQGIGKPIESGWNLETNQPL